MKAGMSLLYSPPSSSSGQPEAVCHPAWNLQAEEANREMLELLADFLPKRFPDRFSMEGTVLINHSLGDSWDLADKSLDPLEVSAQLVQVGGTFCYRSCHIYDCPDRCNDCLRQERHCVARK